MRHVVAHTHEWPRDSTLVCLFLHCFSYMALVSLSFQPDIYSANSALVSTTTLPSSIESCQWAIEISGLVGGVLSIAFILLFFLRPQILHPWLVAGIVGAQFITWVILIGFNCRNLKYSQILKNGDGKGMAQLAAMYCLTTLVATTSLYLFIHSFSVKFVSETINQTPLAITLPHPRPGSNADSKHNTFNDTNLEAVPPRPLSFSPRLSVNTAAFGRHSASTFGYQRPALGSGSPEQGLEMRPLGTSRNEYHPIGAETHDRVAVAL